MQRAQELLRVLRISSFSLTPLGCVFSGPPGDHTNNRLKFPRFLAAPVLSCPVWVRLLLSALPFWPWGVAPPSLPSGVAAEFEAYPRLRFQGTNYIPDEMLPVKLPTGNRTLVPNVAPNRERFNKLMPSCSTYNTMTCLSIQTRGSSFLFISC